MCKIKTKREARGKPKTTNRLIDLFTDMAAILNSFDLRSIIGCQGGMSTFCLYF